MARSSGDQPQVQNAALVAVQQSPELQTVGSKEEVRDTLEKMRSQLEEVLPSRIDADRFLRVCASSIIKSPGLMASTKISIYSAVLEAAQLGLEPTGLLGSAYLVPYKRTVEVPHPTQKNAVVQVRITEAKLIPGYRGLIDLARRSGGISGIWANTVRARDFFRIRQGSDPSIEHDPFVPDPAASQEERDPGPFVGAYMVAVLEGGVRQIEWMTYDQIEAIRKRSKAAEDGPWVSDWPEMARKTVVRRGSKYLPLSPEFRRALELDEEAERQAEDGASTRQERSRALEILRRRGEKDPGPVPEGEPPPDAPQTVQDGPGGPEGSDQASESTPEGSEDPGAAEAPGESPDPDLLVEHLCRAVPPEGTRWV